MKVFLEKGLPKDCQNQIRESFHELGLLPFFMEITFNREKITLDEISHSIQATFNGKNIIVTTRKIEGKRQLGLNFDYHGFANELNGNLAIVTFNEQTKNRIGVVSLHEVLHLLGLNHCKTHGCIMAFKLCDHELRYCLNCPHPCATIQICENCRGELNARTA